MKFSRTLFLLLSAISILSQTTLCGLNDHVDEPLQEGEVYTESELLERQNEAEALKETHPGLFTKETFFKEYDLEKPKHVEVVMAKKYFPTRKSIIDKERYLGLLKMYMDGTVHDEEIDEDIREEAHAQIQEFVEEYVKHVAEHKTDFTVDDLFEDFIAGKFHDWLKKTHPEDDPEIEGDL